MSGGQTITGFSLSPTVTLNVTLVLLLVLSVAVQVTVVTPMGNTEPDTGRQATVTPGQLSCAVGKGNVTTAVFLPGSVGLVMSAGCVSAGFWVSLTVTLKLV